MNKGLAIMIMAITMIAVTGCFNSNLAWRGIVYFEKQDAATEGTITNQPKAGNSQVEAAKEYSDAFKANTDVNSDGKAATDAAVEAIKAQKSNAVLPDADNTAQEGK